MYGWKRAAARVCRAGVCDGRARTHTRAHTRTHEVQARLILPDRAMCIYCALFRACAFFGDVGDRRLGEIDAAFRSFLFLVLREGEGRVLLGRFSFLFFFGDRRAMRAKAKLRNDDVKDGRESKARRVPPR